MYPDDIIDLYGDWYWCLCNGAEELMRKGERIEFWRFMELHAGVFLREA